MTSQTAYLLSYSYDGAALLFRPKCDHCLGDEMHFVWRWSMTVFLRSFHETTIELHFENEITIQIELRNSWKMFNFFSSNGNMTTFVNCVTNFFHFIVAHAAVWTIQWNNHFLNQNWLDVIWLKFRSKMTLLHQTMKHKRCRPIRMFIEFFKCGLWNLLNWFFVYFWCLTGKCLCVIQVIMILSLWTVWFVYIWKVNNFIINNENNQFRAQ